MPSDGERYEKRSNNSKMLYDTDQLRLKHTRIWNRDEMPRYLNEKYKRKSNEPSESNVQTLRDYILAQCDSNDEMNESKQILFAKHIGDESSVKDSDVSLKSSFQFQSDPNEDGLSTDYPDSPQSDRDLSWTENTNLKGTWKNPEQVRVHSTIDAVTKNIEQSTNKLVEEFDELVKSLEEENRKRTPATSESKSFEISAPSIEPSPEKRPSMKIFEERKAMFRKNKNLLVDEEKKKMQSSYAAYKMQGLNREHLIRASKFGTVIDAILKPGHHIGPVKNPDCLCQNCVAYFFDKKIIRERAFSMGNDRYEKTQSRPFMNREYF